MKPIRYIASALICLPLAVCCISFAQEQEAEKHSEDFDKAKAYIQSLGKNEKPAKDIINGFKAYTKIYNEFKSELLRENPEYAGLDKELEEARKKLTELQSEKYNSDPEFRKLFTRQNELAFKLVGNSQDEEIQKELLEVTGKINAYFKNEEAYKKVNELQKAFYKLEQKLIKNSTSPLARECRLLMKEFSKASDRGPSKISFSGLFKGLKPEFMEADIQKMQADFISRKLKEENPGIGIEKINAVVNAVSGKENPDEAIKILAGLTNEGDKKGFTKIFLVLAEKQRPGRAIHREYLKLFDKVIADSAVTGRDAFITARLVMQLNVRDMYLNLPQDLENNPKADPWLKALFQGKAEIIQAWQSRGNGMSNTVTEEGWKGFGEHQDKARKFLKAAHELHPEYPDAATLMIRVEWGRIPLCLEWFKKAVKAQADFSPAYSNMKWTLLPRWGGSQEMLCDFADACIDSDFTDSDIPEYGLAAIVTAAQDVEDYRWQVWYRKATAEKLLKIFEDKKVKAATQDEKDKFSMLQVSVLVALREYEKAASLMTENVKRKIEKLRSYDMLPVNLWINYDNTLKAFIGPNKDAFFKIESDFLNEKAEYERDLLDLIKSGKLSKEEKEFAIDFYGRTKLEEVHVSKLAIYKTALNTAIAENKDINLIKALIELGADCNARTQRGDTALKLAAKSKITPEILDILKKAGAKTTPSPDGNITDSAGSDNKSALYDAIAKNDIGGLKKLIADGANVKSGIYLFAALKRKSPEIFKLLLDSGSDINFKHPKAGFTAFVFALRCNMPRETIEAAIKKGADLNAVDDKGVTVLMHAISTCADPGIISLLLVNGAKVNVGNKNYTPLMVAASLKDGAEKVKILLKAGASVNSQENKGPTPLSMAVARGGNLETVKLLVEAGADLSKKDSRGLTPLDYAEKNKRNEIADYLRSKQ